MKVSYQNDAEPTRQVVMENLPNYDSSGKNEKETNDDITTNPTEIKGKYPKIVFLIILNEFCERFSYYGIRTVLYIFLSGFLALDKDTATAIYHAFTVICYFSPILGAILAGKV
jgi:dipeptide/tripeptide permease